MDYLAAPSSLQRDYVAHPGRHRVENWRAVGRSGLKINPITIGTWQNFSDLDARESVRELYLTAFDNGLFTFDFGNNYGRPPGSAEALFGSFVANELKPYRRELVVATKAGYDMWPGPNGVGSSLKYLISSLDESLARLKLDYVDIFYSHRYDPTCPIEETADALDLARRSGRCLYVGISSYPATQARALSEALSARGTRLAVNQSHYNVLTRWTEDEVIPLCRETGVGFAAFSPLAQGLLSEKYLDAARQDGRAHQENASVQCDDWARLRIALAGLQELARNRGQTIPQLALSWVLRRPEICSAVIGVRTPAQLLDNLKICTAFSEDEEARITELCRDVDVDLWKPVSG